MYFCKTRAGKSTPTPWTWLLIIQPKICRLSQASRTSQHDRSNTAFPPPSTTLTGSIKWPANRESGERKTKMNWVLFSDAAPHRPPTRLLCLPWNDSVSVHLSLCRVTKNTSTGAEASCHGEQWEVRGNGTLGQLVRAKLGMGPGGGGIPLGAAFPSHIRLNQEQPGEGRNRNR